MENLPLHPNLARVAASYDDVMLQWSSRHISDRDARERILALVARDDNGVQWRLSPDSGKWERDTVSRGWVEGVPPTFGLATPTPRDFTATPKGFDPAAQIAFHPVDERALYHPASLTGASRSQDAPASPRRTAGVGTRWLLVLGGVALVSVLATMIH